MATHKTDTMVQWQGADVYVFWWLNIVCTCRLSSYDDPTHVEVVLSCNRNWVEESQVEASQVEESQVEASSTSNDKDQRTQKKYIKHVVLSM